MCQVKVWNARIRIASLASAIDELAKYGPAKPEDLRGLSDVSEATVEFKIRCWKFDSIHRTPLFLRDRAPVQLQEHLVAAQL